MQECLTLDPQIAITVVAILGALSHFIVAVLRGLQDYKRSGREHGAPLPTLATPSDG